MSREELEKRIREEVDKAWENGKPILLSELGALDGGEVARSARREASNLTSFIRDCLADEVALVKHSKIPAAVGAVPANQTPEEGSDTDKLLEARLVANKGEGSEIQFNRRFWTAFRKSVEAGEKRYIQIEAPFRFENRKEDETPSEGFVEIPQKYIATDNAVPDKDVYANIKRWAEERDLDLDAFSYQQRLVDRYERQRGPSVLDSLLDALDSQDLKRLEMPLDIVWKLRKSKP